MKSITQWHDNYNEKKNDQELSEELKYYHEELSFFDENVINDKMKAFAY